MNNGANDKAMLELMERLVVAQEEQAEMLAMIGKQLKKDAESQAETFRSIDARLQNIWRSMP